MRFTGTILLLFVCAIAAQGRAADPESLLESRCIDCHSLDTRKGGLRVDSVAALLTGGDSGNPAVQVGDADASLLIARVTSDDPETRMPPKGPALSAEEVAALRAWIDDAKRWTETSDDGAAVQSDHWAFQLPLAPPLPATTDTTWSRNAIDAFILARLEAKGLRPSPEADRATLIRRLSLDLIGLPPTPDEIAAFVADKSPTAYDDLVERLLASPHYGERQAVRWLDAARYADTNGYEKDRTRSVWPYRDWVIDAYNRDLPYDRFVIEQIAGDLLPGATPDQHIATGFLRNSMINEEGGVDVEEFRYEAMVDRTSTVATAFLGMTFACAQCHTHKFDPITQREYFSFYAYLNNTDDVDYVLEDEAIAKKRARIRGEVEAAIDELSRQFPAESPEEDHALARAAHLNKQFAAWETTLAPKAVDWSLADPVAMHSKGHATLTRLDDGSILASGDNPNTDTYTITLRSDEERISAIRIEALPHDSLPGGGPGRGVIMSEGDFLLSEIGLEAAPWNTPEALAPVALTEASQDYAHADRNAALALDGKLDTGWSVKDALGKPHVAVFNLATPIEASGGAVLRLTLDQYYVHQHTLGRFRISVVDAPESVVTTGLPSDLEAALLSAKSDRTPAQRAALRRQFLLTTPELAEEQQKIARLEASIPQFPTTLALAEREVPRVTRMHKRGEFLSPGATVLASMPAVLPAAPEHAPANRLTLARWITAPENPLTARVAVNRAWQGHFGQGLVTTPEDFGTRGARPSHPELLDWLAVEFQRRAWSRKELTRLIVTSATYRQSSNVTPALIEADPQNTLLARGPRFRAEAELVRDIALAASGLLNPEIGGPSVYPPIPDGALSLVYPDPNGWPTAKGADRYRRGFYTFWKRTLPFPTAAVFDAPTRDSTCVRRVRSSTPLQALTLLNDEVFMDVARALAGQVLNEADGDREKALQIAFLRCTGRQPDPQELTWLTDYLDQQRARFAEGRADATVLGKNVGEAGSHSPETLAAWTLVCRVILNLDETITRS